MLVAHKSQRRILTMRTLQLTVDKSNYYAFKMDDIEEAHSHVNFMQLATDRAAYRLADQYDQEVLGYMAGYAQSSLHSVADAVNTSVSGSVAVSTAGTDELLTSMKLRKDSLPSITTSSAGDHSIPVQNLAPGATSVSKLQLLLQWLLLTEWLDC